MSKDKTKGSKAFGKRTKTINFDELVLQQLEQLALEQNTKVSHIVNMVCRQNILGDCNFHRAMAKEHYIKFQEHKYLADELKVIVED